jgi:hypothetical protein
VTSIGDWAFYGCSSLTSVTIGNSVTSIGVYVFRDCSSLTEIIISDSVTSIGYGAFRECSSLTEIVIPDSVTSIQFEGTVEQWNAIEKEYNWNAFVFATEVVCSDGVVTLD